MPFGIGYFLIRVAVLGSFVKRLTFTPTMIYLAAGVIIGQAASALRIRMRS